MDAQELMEMICEAKEEFGYQETAVIGEICIAAAYFGKWIVDNNYPMPSNSEEGVALLLKLLIDDDETFDKVDTWMENHSAVFEAMARDGLENKDKEEEAGD